jgi:hypothetical protein
MQLKYDKVVYALVIGVCLTQAILGGLAAPLAVLGSLAILCIGLESVIKSPVKIKELELENEKQVRLSLNTKEIQEFRDKLTKLEDHIKGTDSRISAMGMIKRG